MKDDKTSLKVVVRNLPPQLNEEQFKVSVQKYLDNVDFWYFVPGKQTEKKSVNSRAYLNFTSPEALSTFKNQYEQHVFITAKGKEMKPVMEYAIHQKVPKGATKKDARENTIADDPEYLQFLEELNKPQINLPSAEEQLDKRLAEEKELAAASGGSIPGPIPPLIQFLREKRAMKEKKLEKVYILKRDKDKNPKAKPPKEKSDRKEPRKKDGKPKDAKPEKKEGAEGKRGNNGVWKVRTKPLEPGTIAILNKDQQPAQQDQQQQPQQQPPQQSSTEQASSEPNKKGSNTNYQNRRGSRPESGKSKAYTPKPRQDNGASSQAVNSTDNS